MEEIIDWPDETPFKDRLVIDLLNEVSFAKSAANPLHLLTRENLDTLADRLIPLAKRVDDQRVEEREIARYGFREVSGLLSEILRLEAARESGPATTMDDYRDNIESVFFAADEVAKSYG